MVNLPELTIVIPAAGIGKRMQAAQAKQYLTLHGKTIIEHTIERFLNLPFVATVVVALAKDDVLFEQLTVAKHNKIVIVDGGKERADSVLNGLSYAEKQNSDWVLVHDAARPCVSSEDIINLYNTCIKSNSAGILASPVRDTMKRSVLSEIGANVAISETVDRTNMWHALTPQCAKTAELKQAISSQVDDSGWVNKKITDEASALELAKKPVLLVEGSVKNLKVTMPEDLELAEFYLSSLAKTQAC